MSNAEEPVPNGFYWHTLQSSPPITSQDMTAKTEFPVISHCLPSIQSQDNRESPKPPTYTIIQYIHVHIPSILHSMECTENPSQPVDKSHLKLLSFRANVCVCSSTLCSPQICICHILREVLWPRCSRSLHLSPTVLSTSLETRWWVFPAMECLTPCHCHQRRRIPEGPHRGNSQAHGNCVRQTCQEKEYS